MGIEIERRFLVDARKVRSLNFESAEKISQGYLSDKPTIRVRLKNNCAFLTIKSLTVGIFRQEFEYEISADDAKALLKLCGAKIIQKTRRKISWDGHIWEVDFFEGRHKGLILAEVELSSENEPFNLPDWITKEVSNNPRYFNSNLVKNDFRPVRRKKRSRRKF